MGLDGGNGEGLIEAGVFLQWNFYASVGFLLG
jgi:hypothetical protein